MEKNDISEDNTSTPINQVVERSSPTSSEEYENVRNESSDHFKDRHLLELRSKFREEFSTQIPDPYFPKVILDSNTQPKERKRITESLKDATVGQGKKRLKSIEKNGSFRPSKGKKRAHISSYLVSAKKGVWADTWSHLDGNLHIHLHNDSVDDLCQKKDGLYDHYDGKLAKFRKIHSDTEENVS